MFRKPLSRAKLLPFPGSLPPCLVGLEVCSGTHYWGREPMKLGRWVGIMSPRFVAPYRKGGKILLGRTTKKGDAYLRTLLIHGTRAVLSTVKDNEDRPSICGPRP